MHFIKDRVSWSRSEGEELISTGHHKMELIVSVMVVVCMIMQVIAGALNIMFLRWNATELRSINVNITTGIQSSRYELL